MNFRLRRWLSYLVFLVIVLVLCWQNSASSEDLTNSASSSISAIFNFFGLKANADNLYLWVRKGGHFVAFALLGMLGHLAISGDANDVKSACICSVIVNFIIAMFAEFSQAYALNRYPTFLDALINLAGVSLGIIIGLVIEAIRNYREQHFQETA